MTFPLLFNLQNDTKVWIVWAFASNGSDAFAYHQSNKAIVSPQHNLIAEAMSAAMQPSATPTTKNAGSDVGSRVVTYAILALIICVLHF